jgi:hypothetical protein
MHQIYFQSSNPGKRERKPGFFSMSLDGISALATSLSF